MLIDALSDPARKNREDDDRQLSGHGIVIVIGNYIVFHLFYEQGGTSACNRNPDDPRRNRFAPFRFLS